MKKVAKLWKVGDLVFAKLKGYPPWPAKIIEIINTRHNVYFYGTGETGSVKKEDLWHYADKKAVMASSKQLKNKKFAEAVRQIEEAMTGNDAPLDAPLDGGANAVHQDLTEILVQEPQKKPIAKKPTMKNKLPSINPKIKPEPIKQEVIQIKSNPNVSRSGREIKAKREHYDINDIKFEEDNKKIKLQSSKKTKPVVSQADSTDELGFDYKGKRSTEVLAKKNHQMMETNLVTLNMKVRTSVGLEKTADPKKCHELMQEYATIDITALMLKKNPNVVETVKRLRKYIGNTRQWTLSENEAAQFAESAQAVRSCAEEVYDRFKECYNWTETDGSFWTMFNNKVKEFNFKTKHFNRTQLFDLWDEAGLDQEAEG